MKLHLYLLAMLIFSFTIFGMLFVFTDINKIYGDNLDLSDDFGDTYNQINETYDLTQDIKADTLDTELEGGDESWESMTKGSYKSVRTGITGSFKIVSTFLREISSALKIPPFIGVFALVALTLTAIFALIYMIFRYSG